jgi:hypothetical protein
VKPQKKKNKMEKFKEGKVVANHVFPISGV